MSNASYLTFVGTFLIIPIEIIDAFIKITSPIDAIIKPCLYGKQPFKEFLINMKMMLLGLNDYQLESID